MSDKIKVLKINKNLTNSFDENLGDFHTNKLWFDENSGETILTELDKTMEFKTKNISKIDLVQNANSHFFAPENSNNLAFQKTDIGNNKYESINLVDKMIMPRRSDIRKEIIDLRVRSYENEQNDKDYLLNKLNIDLKPNNKFKNYNLARNENLIPKTNSYQQELKELEVSLNKKIDEIKKTVEMTSEQITDIFNNNNKEVVKNKVNKEKESSLVQKSIEVDLDKKDNETVFFSKINKEEDKNNAKDKINFDNKKEFFENQLDDEKLLSANMLLVENKLLTENKRLMEEKLLVENKLLAENKKLNEEKILMEQKFLAEKKLIEVELEEENGLAQIKLLEEKRKMTEERWLTNRKLIIQKKLAEKRLHDEQSKALEEQKKVIEKQNLEEHKSLQDLQEIEDDKKLQKLEIERDEMNIKQNSETKIEAEQKMDKIVHVNFEDENAKKNNDKALNISNTLPSADLDTKELNLFFKEDNNYSLPVINNSDYTIANTVDDLQKAFNSLESRNKKNKVKTDFFEKDGGTTQLVESLQVKSKLTKNQNQNSFNFDSFEDWYNDSKVDKKISKLLKKEKKKNK
ncbi:hypothetical protein [Spiroplasma endosymbiont of Dioctria linearis]|uniref:hypothetical protein n=1 Tax=Spiroplasma endosymbiont of Dioctria linearis TaxID=3066290 RepID=UPI00313DA128